jgi:hypothetical protein
MHVIKQGGIDNSEKLATLGTQHRTKTNQIKMQHNTEKLKG